MKRTLALTAIGLAAPTHAASGPFTYQCSAPFWDPAGLWQANAGPLRRVGGQVEISRLDDIPAEWRDEGQLRGVGPVTDMRGAEVTLSNAEDGNIHVSVAMAPLARSDERINVAVYWRIGERDGGQTVEVPRRTGRLTRIPFTMINEGRQVIVEAAGMRVVAPIALGSDNEFRISCQGGEFMFYGLDWGR